MFPEEPNNPGFCLRVKSVSDKFALEVFIEDMKARGIGFYLNYEKITPSEARDLAAALIEMAKVYEGIPKPDAIK